MTTASPLIIAIPIVTSKALKLLGFPSGIANTIAAVRGDQRRWVFLDNQSHATPMRVLSAMPQGDSWAVLATRVWMGAGVNWVRERLHAKGMQVKQAVYMDDRTWTADVPEHVVHAGQCWRQWSRSHGLFENEKMLQWAAHGKANRALMGDALSGSQHRPVQHFLDVLGAALPTTYPSQPDKVRQRVIVAGARAKRIRAIPASRERTKTYLRCFALSKFSYG